MSEQLEALDPSLPAAAAPGASPAPPAPPAPPPPDESGRGFWSAVREGLRGSHRDYTTGPIGRAVLVLAIPMVLEMVMESVFAVCDIFFVSHLGADAVASVGFTETFLVLVYTIASGLAIGATAVVARRTGERDREGAAHGAAQAILLALGVAAVIGVAGAWLAPRLLAAMGATPGVVRIGTGYARVMLGGNATILLLFLGNAIFRGAGDAAIAMRTLWLANAINIALGPMLIFGVGPFPRLAVTGAAVATNIGRGTGVLFALWRMSRPSGRIALRRRHWRLDVGVMRRMLKLSSSATVQVLIATASWIVLVRILATFGSDALAGYTIAWRVVAFALLPSFGLANAAATMVGQALGARKPERAERAVWIAGSYNALFLGLIGVAFVLGAHAIIRGFTPDPRVIPYGAACLRTVAYGFVFYGFGMVLGQAFNGAGDTRTPTLLNVLVFWLWEIPLAWLLAEKLGYGPEGVFASIAIAFSTMAVLAALVFRRGRWRRVGV